MGAVEEIPVGDEHITEVYDLFDVFVVVFRLFECVNSRYASIR